jgi:hypothetical protein
MYKNRWVLAAAIGVLAWSLMSPEAEARRQYNPGPKRFMQRDPAGYAAHMSAYQYGRHAPTSVIDPTGLLPQTCLVCCADTWACIPCSEKYSGQGDVACQSLGYAGQSADSQCAAATPPPLTLCATPNTCPPGYPQEDPSWFASNTSWCKDGSASGVLHPGEQCYREVTATPGTTMPGPTTCPPARHVCFDKKTGRCSAHTDLVGNAEGTNADGSCNFNAACTCFHWAVDL